MSELGRYQLSKGWRWSTIPELVGDDGLFCDGDWIETEDQDPNGDVRLVQLADVGDGVYRDKSNRYLTSPKATELRCTYLKPNDVLIARMPDPLGRACIFPGDRKRSVTAVDVCIVRSNNGDFDHRWLVWFVNAPPFRAAIAGLQSGSTRKRISRKNLGTIPLPVPPIEEQKQIVAEIEKQFTRLEAGAAGLRRVQANLKRYRAAVLKAACEGKLVPTQACLRQAERGRQAELAREEGRALPAPRPGLVFVYAIRCDNDSIYIGQTQDLQKRWKEHLAGQAADWTGQHKPVLIVHYEEYSSREEAVAREKWLKTGFGRKWIRREIAAGRLPADQVGARQAGFETGAELLERILTERRNKWNGKGKYKEPAKPDTVNLLPLPEGWAWARLEELSFVSGGLTKNPKRSQLRTQLPYLRVANVYANELRLEEIEHIGVEESELEKLLLRPNDLLVVEGNGSKDQIGRLAIWDGSIDPCVHQNHLIKVRPVLSQQAKWVLYWLLSPIGRQFVEIVASSTSGLYTLSVNKIGDLPVAIPPLGEEQRIVAEIERRLSVVDELEAVVNANLRRTTRLRQSVLARAFAGTLFF